MTRASVLIPIHDKPTTLPLSVDTVLHQSVSDLEVLLIGDGVTDDVRDVVATLTRTDDRVRFLDFPKGPHHGERHRHDAIEAASSDAIFYLCDDDLLLPDHVADLLPLLEDHDLVQCLNGYVTADGQVRLYAADLADPECVALHVRDDLQFCSVSITGTAHNRSAYRGVSRWDTTPSGQWPDHWQFRKLMRRPGFRGATSSRMTALQFPTSSDGRDTWDDGARAAEVVPWHRLVTSPGGQAEVDRRVAAGMLAQLVEQRAQIGVMQHELRQVHVAFDEHREEAMSVIATQRIDLRAQQDELVIRRTDVETLRHDIDVLMGEIHTLRGAAAGHAGEADELRQHTVRLTQIRTEHEERLAALRAKVRQKNATIAELRGDAPPRPRS